MARSPLKSGVRLPAYKPRGVQVRQDAPNPRNQARGEVACVPRSNNARRPLCLMSIRQLSYTMFHVTIPISAMLTGPSRVLWGQKYELMQSRTLAKVSLRPIQVGPRRNPMKLGVFLPNGSNGYIMSKAIPPYMPTWELNRDITLEAERLGFDFVLSMMKFRGFGGETGYWDGATMGDLRTLRADY